VLECAMAIDRQARAVASTILQHGARTH